MNEVREKKREKWKNEEMIKDGVKWKNVENMEKWNDEEIEDSD